MRYVTGYIISKLLKFFDEIYIVYIFIYMYKYMCVYIGLWICRGYERAYALIFTVIDA